MVRHTKVLIWWVHVILTMSRRPPLCCAGASAGPTTRQTPKSAPIPPPEPVVTTRTATDQASPPWTAADGAALYGLDRWEEPYFSVGAPGQVMVQLRCERGAPSIWWSWCRGCRGAISRCRC
jgi:hypothetical protein